MAQPDYKPYYNDSMQQDMHAYSTTGGEYTPREREMLAELGRRTWEERKAKMTSGEYTQWAQDQGKQLKAGHDAWLSGLTPQAYAEWIKKLELKHGPLSPEQISAMRLAKIIKQGRMSYEERQRRKEAKRAMALAHPERIAKMREGLALYQQMGPEAYRAEHPKKEPTKPTTEQKYAKLMKRLGKMSGTGGEGMATARGLLTARGYIHVGAPKGGFIGPLLTGVASLVIPIVKAIATKIARKHRAKVGGALREGVWAKRLSEKAGPMNSHQFWKKAFEYAAQDIPMYFKDQALAKSLAKKFLKEYGTEVFGDRMKKLKKSPPTITSDKMTLADFIAPIVQSVATEEEMPQVEAILQHPQVLKETGAGIFGDLVGLVKEPAVQQALGSIGKTLWSKARSKIKGFITGRLMKKPKVKQIVDAVMPIVQKVTEPDAVEQPKELSSGAPTASEPPAKPDAAEIPSTASTPSAGAIKCGGVISNPLLEMASSVQASNLYAGKVGSLAKKTDLGW